MTVDEVIAAASAQCGLSGIGDPSALDGLGRLLDSYASEAKFTERGAMMAHGFLVTQMKHRMQIEGWLAEHPELLDRPIDKPLFVFGLPRTGTTLMINLIAADPARRSFMRWESLEPIPPATPEEIHGGRRFEVAKAQGEMAKQHMPHIAAIHWEEPDSPTECQFLMTPSFCSQVYESQAAVPSYRRWFMFEADYRPAFAFHKRTLQALQHHAGGRWTLKNPWHPLYLDALVGTYPDAQLVMTHRDPADVVGSICSLIKHVRRIYSDTVDLKAIGRDFMETFEVMIERTVAFKEARGEGSILDVQYADTTTDPMGVVERIYANFDEPLTDAARAAMQKYMDDNPKGKHGKHDYDLAEYGLDRAGVHRRFAGYIDRFAIPVRE